MPGVFERMLILLTLPVYLGFVVFGARISDRSSGRDCTASSG